MFDKIFGLPLHVLVIHAVVVLVPLCAIAVVVMLFSAKWRERLRWPVLILLTVAMLSTFVAKQSGEAFRDRLGLDSPELTKHADLGDKAPWIVLGFWMLTVAWLVLDWRRDRDGSPGPGALRLLGVLAVLAAIGATTWIVLTGDAGARQVYGHAAPSPTLSTTP